MSISLRDYQQKTVEDIRACIRRCINRIAVVMPTGAGKSRTACHIIESAIAKGNTCVVLVNREKLVRQWDSVMDELGIKHGIIQYGHPETEALVQIASVDSYVTRLNKRFDIVIADEMQYSLAENYKACIDHQNATLSIGLSATPTRMNGEGFLCLYDEIVQGVEMAELMERGYLSKMEIYSPNPPDVDLELVDGDFNTAQYMRKVSGTKRISDAVEKYKETINGKLTIVFATSINDARNIAKQFNDAGISAKAIHSKQALKTQDQILDGFRNREYLVLVSVTMLAEGMDIPWIEACIDLAPTASLARYIQKLGRCIRAYPGKEKATVLDMCGNYWLHGAPWKHHEWSLEGKKPTKKALQEAMLSARLCTSCGHMYDSSNPCCPYCGSGKKQTKRMMKEKAGKLVLVTEAEYERIEQEKRDKEQRKQDAKARRKAARTLADYEAIERDFGYKRGWGYVNYRMYKKTLDKYRR